jgi:hypothetical protein
MHSSTFVDDFEKNYTNLLLLVFSGNERGHVMPLPPQVLSFSFFLSCSLSVEAKTLKCSLHAFSCYTKLMVECLFVALSGLFGSTVHRHLGVADRREPLMHSAGFHNVTCCNIV